MKIFVRFLCILLWLGGGIAFAQARSNVPMTFKGVALGATEEQFTTKLRGYSCAQSLGLRNVRKCTRSPETYGGQRVEEVAAMFIGGQLTGLFVTVAQGSPAKCREDYRHFAELIAEKWGPAAGSTANTLKELSYMESDWVDNQIFLVLDLEIPRDKRMLRDIGASVRIRMTVPDYRDKMAVAIEKSREVDINSDM